jgi:hypothetical protein
MTRGWGPSHFCWHGLGGVKCGPDDFETVCTCKWRIYYGDASVLPPQVQKSFSWVVHHKALVKLICFGHALRHLVGLAKYE